MSPWLYVIAIVCAALGAWVLVPSPLEHLPRFGGSHVIGARPNAMAWLKRLFGRSRRASATDVMPELSPLLRSGFGRGDLDAPKGILPRLFAMAAKIVPVSEERAHELDGWLGYVGSGLSAQEFSGLKVLTTLIGDLAVFALVPEMVKQYPWLLLLAATVGFFVPDLWLNNSVASRHKSTLRLLPEVIDLLALCMGAGLDFLGALNRVIAAKAVGKKKEPLLEELSVVMQEIKFGKRRAEALKAMGKRVNLPELSSFVRTLVQADRMGTPIGEVLAIHAEDVRFQRWTRAERAALKAPIKILMPLIFCILPCVAIIVAAPIFLQFSKMNLNIIK